MSKVLNYRPFRTCTWTASQCSELEPPPSKKLKITHTRALQPSKSEEHSATKRHTATPEYECLKMVRSKGQYLWDSEDTKYLDLATSSALVGHCEENVVQAATSQMTVLNTNSRFLNDNIVMYAQHLCSKLPQSLSCCFFTNSGAEANDLALQIALVVTGCKHTVALQGVSHGGLMSLKSLRHSSEDVTIAALPDCYRGQYTGPETAGKQYADDLTKLIKDKSVAAFIHQSVLTGSTVVPPANYLQHVYKHIHNAGGLCIADELETGFGRLGQYFWGFEAHSVCPDIVTLGNCMGNGHPVAAVVTTRDIADKFSDKGMEYFNTFGGNPVSMATAEAVLCVVEEKKLAARARVMGDALLVSLKALKEKHSCIGDVRGSGLCLGVDFIKSSESKEPAPDLAQAVQKCFLKEHQIIADIAGSVLMLKPPLVVMREDCELVSSALDSTLTKIHALTR